jgi:hypothetical protein
LNHKHKPFIHCKLYLRLKEWKYVEVESCEGKMAKWGKGKQKGFAGPAIAGMVAPGVVTMGDGTLDMKPTGDPSQAADAACRVEGGPEAPWVFERDDLGGCGIVGMLRFKVCKDQF